MERISPIVHTGASASDHAQQIGVERAFAAMVNRTLDPSSQSFMMLRVRKDGTFAQPPSMPGALGVANATSGAHTLTWGASTDADPILGYIVLRDGKEVARLGPDARTWSDPTSGVHDWEVRAYDQNGAVSQGTTAPMATQAAEQQAAVAAEAASKQTTTSTAAQQATTTSAATQSTAAQAATTPSTAAQEDTGQATSVASTGSSAPSNVPPASRTTAPAPVVTST